MGIIEIDRDVIKLSVVELQACARLLVNIGIYKATLSATK